MQLPQLACPFFLSGRTDQSFVAAPSFLVAGDLRCYTWIARRPRPAHACKEAVMSRMIRSAALFLLLVPFPAGAAVTCADVLKVLGPSLADVNCFASTDLTTTQTR